MPPKRSWRTACPPAPREACDVLAATATWWRILSIRSAARSTPRFNAETERAIASTEAWVAREPDSAEAQFYAGGAYAARVQWRVLRDEKLAAARDGKRIKQALERAIELDPALEDAYFGIGLYRYLRRRGAGGGEDAALPPDAPGRRQGGGPGADAPRARRGAAAARRSGLPAADHLSLVREAGRSGGRAPESLRAAIPRNPLFVAELADVHDRYQHDITASLATWRALLAAARAGRVQRGRRRRNAGPPRHRPSARAAASDRRRPRRAARRARRRSRHGRAARWPPPTSRSAKPRTASATTTPRSRPIVSPSRTAPAPIRDDIRQRARSGCSKTPDAARAEAYRLSLEGLRKLEKGDIAGAESALARSLTLDPRQVRSPAIATRTCCGAKKDEQAALAQFDAVMRGARDCPAPIAAAAYLEAARIHERLAHRDKAIAYYRAPSTWFGGAAESAPRDARAERALLPTARVAALQFRRRTAETVFRGTAIF